MDDDWEEDEFVDYFDPFTDCPTCQGSGRVTTEDFESYNGANYKPCPECRGDPCIGEPDLS